MSLQFAKAPYSVTWKDWLLSHLFPAEFSSRFDISGLSNKINYTAFTETYETDGMDVSDGSYTLATGDENYEDFYLDLAIKNEKAEFPGVFKTCLTLLGLPTRANTVVFSNILLISLKQFGKNLIGGWDSDPKISKEKKFWQWASLPIKIGIILPWKLISLPFKILINGVKIISEWLPLWLATWCAALLGLYRSTRYGKAHFPVSANWKSDALSAFVATLLVALLKLPYLILGALYFTFKLIALVGRSITSPLKSARMAFRYGRELKVTLFGASEWGEFFNRLTSNFIGVLGLLISMSMTALFWIIILPAAVVGAITSFPVAFPWLFQVYAWFSQLPPVVALVSWFSQLPVLTLANGLIAPLGIALTQVFGTAIVTVGAFVGVQLSLAYTITGSALALITAMVTPLLTLVGEVLSNRWATWTNGGPVTALLSYFTSKASSPIKASDEVPLVNDQDHNSSVSVKSAELQEISEGAQKDTAAALTHVDNIAAYVTEQAPYRRFQEGKLNKMPDFAELYDQEQQAVNQC